MLTNARDYRSEAHIRDLILRKRKLFAAAGFQAEALDLRPYFGRQSELAQLLAQQQPGVICALGGNVFLLATALRLSGADELLRELLLRDETIYAGSSAGAMVAARDLQLYDYRSVTESSSAMAARLYGVKSVLVGLGLIDEYIVPHANLTANADRREYYLQNIAQSGEKAIILDDADAYVVEGTQKRILRGDD